MKKKLKIVKIGGNLLDSEPLLHEVLDRFSTIREAKILIHGGGKMATGISQKLGIESQMYEGRRVTTEEDLKIVTMVYAGWLNKTIVAKLQQRGCQAIGLSGADANTIVSEKRPVHEVDFGWVGDVQQVNSLWISLLLERDLTPVFCAITHDGSGHLLNTNADTIAAEIAAALSQFYETELIYVFEKKGVLKDLNDENSVIEKLDFQSYQNGKSAGIFHSGMLPKLHTGFGALQKDVGSVIIGDYTTLNYEAHVCTKLLLN